MGLITSLVWLFSTSLGLTVQSLKVSSCPVTRSKLVEVDLLVFLEIDLSDSCLVEFFKIMTYQFQNTSTFITQGSSFSAQNAIFLPNVILDESNYHIWLFRIESFLKSMQLFDFVDGSFLCPPKFLLSENGISSTLNPEYLEWKSKDQSVIHMLSQTLSPVAMIWAVGSVSAAHLWDNLKQRFASTYRQNILQMKSNLYELKKGLDSIDEYLDKVKAAKDKLATVGVYPDDDDVLVIVLRGLPSSFAVIKTVIRSQPVSLTLSEIRTLLKGAELDIDTDSNGSQSPLPAMLAFGHSNMFEDPSNKSNSCQLCNTPGHTAKQCSKLHMFIKQSTQSPVECQYCGRKFHTADKCYHLVGFPPSYRQKPNNAVTHQSLSQIYSQANSSKSSSNLNQDFHQGSSQGVQNPMFASSINSPQFCFSDTGASQHMTGDPSILTDMVSFPTADSVTIGYAGTDRINNTLDNTNDTITTQEASTQHIDVHTDIPGSNTTCEVPIRSVADPITSQGLDNFLSSPSKSTDITPSNILQDSVASGNSLNVHPMLTRAKKGIFNQSKSFL